MPLIFSGASPTALTAHLRAQKALVIEEVAAITTKAVGHGSALQKELLDRAVTASGESRYARGRGGSAGRNDTGQMIEDVDDRVTISTTEVVGEWGWLDRYEDYYDFQDNGTSRIPAARSLIDSFVVIREEWLKDLRNLVA